MSIPASKIKEIAASLNLELVGVLSREQAELTLLPNAERLGHWQAAGYAGEMRYMQRNPEIFKSFDSILPACKSVLMFVVPYWQGEKLPDEPKPGYGRVARYAWGLDYHQVIRARLLKLAELLEKHHNKKISHRCFSDAVPILERALATSAGLGVVGRNTLMIRPGVGSFTFLAEVLLDVEVEVDESTASKRVARLKTVNDESLKPGTSCGTCHSCLENCPTTALESSGVLNSKKCISYLTIEKRSYLSDWEQQAIGSWVFGCDVCQDVCPFNHKGVEKSEHREFSPEFGAGPFLNLKSLLSIRSKSQFEKLYANTALMRAGRELLLRNACCVVANQKGVELTATLAEVAVEDPSEMVRTHAKFALLRLEEHSTGQDLKRIKDLLQSNPILQLSS